MSVPRKIVQEGAVFRRLRPGEAAPPEVEGGQALETKKQTIKILPATTSEVRIEYIRGAMLRGLPMLPLLEAHERTAILCCPGPSLADTWHEIQSTEDLYTVSGAHDYLISRGITPAGHWECETRAHKITLLREKSRHQAIIYYVASCCPSGMFDYLEGVRTVLWHCKNSREEREFIYELNHDAWIVDGGSSVGLSAIAGLTALGYRSFEIHGMDCSWSYDDAYVMEHPNPEEIRIKIRRPDTNESWWTNPQLYVAADEFVRFASVTPYLFHLRGRGMLQSITRKLPRISHDERPAGDLQVR